MTARSTSRRSSSSPAGLLHGGEAKALIAEGLVLVNGAVELRKRRKMALGDTVAMQSKGALP